MTAGEAGGIFATPCLCDKMLKGKEQDGANLLKRLGKDYYMSTIVNWESGTQLEIILRPGRLSYCHWAKGFSRAHPPWRAFKQFHSGSVFWSRIVPNETAAIGFLYWHRFN